MQKQVLEYLQGAPDEMQVGTGISLCREALQIMKPDIMGIHHLNLGIYRAILNVVINDAVEDARPRYAMMRLKTALSVYSPTTTAVLKKFYLMFKLSWENGLGIDCAKDEVRHTKKVCV